MDISVNLTKVKISLDTHTQNINNIILDLLFFINSNKIHNPAFGNQKPSLENPRILLANLMLINFWPGSTFKIRSCSDILGFKRARK
jgi:hypothetical protein